MRANTNTITAWLPTNQVFQYDANGNLITDGRRGYDYDDEDQLIRITETNSWKSEFTYDGRFRLRVRKEYTWNAGSGVWVLGTETRYVYDGMLCIQERDGSNVPTITYTRGRDLSGSREGAGGIGGLLALTEHKQTAASVATAYYHCDGNGNVTALVNTNGVIVARYAYDPYGNMLAISGPRSAVNRYRFSSKEQHERSGLYSFGRRFYSPEWQRWLSRDPIEEDGGVNLYAYVGNSPISYVDELGEEKKNFWANMITTAMLGYNAFAGLVDPSAKVLPKIEVPEPPGVSREERKELQGNAPPKIGPQPSAGPPGPPKPKIYLEPRPIVPPPSRPNPKFLKPRLSKVPWLVLGFFAYDCYTVGPVEAANNATWPASVLWNHPGPVGPAPVNFYKGPDGSLYGGGDSPAWFHTVTLRCMTSPQDWEICPNSRGSDSINRNDMCTVSVEPGCI